QHQDDKLPEIAVPVKDGIISFPVLLCNVLYQTRKDCPALWFCKNIRPEQFPEPGKKPYLDCHLFLPVVVFLVFFSPHTGQAGFLSTQISSARASMPSQRKSRSVRSLPSWVRYFSTSVACTIPMSPGVTPTTGKTSFGGGLGKMHLRHGVAPGMTVVACPYSPRIAPWKSGMFFVFAASLRR